MDRKSLASAVFVALVVVACFVLAGCNTVEGVGKDIENAGEGLQKAAD